PELWQVSHRRAARLAGRRVGAPPVRFELIVVAAVELGDPRVEIAPQLDQVARRRMRGIVGDAAQPVVELLLRDVAQRVVDRLEARRQHAAGRRALRIAGLLASLVAGLLASLVAGLLPSLIAGLLASLVAGLLAA